MSGEPMHALASGAAAPAPVHPTTYRPDIDGLRAICVGAVIVYHLAPNRFPAGGIGVDLFFVISGYLIGGIVLASAERGRFSFADFYLRRVRRIAPAFIATVLASSAAALVLLYPWELEAFAWSALAALACGSNVYFWLTADYFAANSDTLPLLHTWSLGVEEQFYLLFPLLPLLIGAARRARWVTIVLLATIALSLAISVYQVRTAPVAGFYLLPSRWWELMAGVAATRLPARWIGPPLLRALAAAAGLALIAGSLLLVQPSRGFPGWAAAPACLGGVLVLVSGRAGPSVFHALLGLSPLRLVGLASYSLYLWHWPVLVFYKADRVIGRLSITDALIVSALTALLGFSSWWFVERPFRRHAMSPRRLLAWCGGGFALAAAIQAAFLLGQGWPSRIPPRALEIARYADGRPQVRYPDQHCFLPDSDPVASYDAASCLASAPPKPDWLLVGDSHAGMLWSGLMEELPAVNVQSAVAFGCDVAMEPVPTGRACGDLMHRILVEHLAQARPAALVLTWRWMRVEPAALLRLADRLGARGVRLVVIGPTPEYTVPVARVLAEAVRRGDPSLTGKALSPRLWPVDAQLRALAKGRFLYVSPMRAMCPTASTCIVTHPDGRPLYFDGEHYSAEGSAFVWRRLLEVDAAEGAPLATALGRPPASARP